MKAILLRLLCGLPFGMAPLEASSQPVGWSDLLRGPGSPGSSLASQIRRAQDSAQQPPAAVRPVTGNLVRDESIPPVSLSKTIQSQSNAQRSTVALALSDDINELQAELDSRIASTDKTPDLLREIDVINQAITAKRQAMDFALGNTTKVSNAAAEAFAAVNNPYFLICQDVLWAPKDPLKWSEQINPRKAALLQAGRSVGMIVRDEQLVGTAFVVGNSHVMTNLHVLKAIGELDAKTRKWRLHPNVKLRFDVEYPLGESSGCATGYETHTYYLNGVWAVPKKDEDMAILLSSRDEKFPPKLTVSSRPESLYSGNMVVAVIGYPGLPADMTVGEQLEYFRSPNKLTPQYPYKRLSAGYTGTTAVTERGLFTHKANTAGGSSGAPVLDLADGSVIGIHMQGYSRFNDVMGYNEGIVGDRILELLKAADLMR